VFSVNGLADDVLAGGGEVSVVVVDVDQLDVLTRTYSLDQTSQRFDDVRDAAGQRVGVFVFIRVQHVDYD
jgi:hypothetical protein